MILHWAENEITMILHWPERCRVHHWFTASRIPGLIIYQSLCQRKNFSTTGKLDSMAHEDNVCKRCVKIKKRLEADNG